MKEFINDLELLESCGILPNLYYSLQYEIYNMKPNIGIKVQKRCIILFADGSFEVVLENTLPEEKSGIVQTCGFVLFQKVLQVFSECSNDINISPSLHLISKVNAYSVKVYTILFLLWNYVSSLIISDYKDLLPSSSAMLQSKKMPTDDKFLENFYEKYNTLCKCKVISNPRNPMKYKICYFEGQERRHFGIVCQMKHSFVVELSCKKFENVFYNCPNIRYFSDDEKSELIASHHNTRISADKLVNIAIKIVGKMGDYNVINNNCQNFVQNYLHALNANINIKQLEGERIQSFMQLKFIRYLKIFLLTFCYIYDKIPSTLYPFVNIVVIILILLKVLKMIYTYLSREDSVWNDLGEIIISFMILHHLSHKNYIIFHIFSVLILIFFLRIMRLNPSYWFFGFLLLTLLVGLVTKIYFLVPTLTSLAVALQTALFGAWSVVGSTYHLDLAIILPCIINIIVFHIADLSWKIMIVIFLVQLFLMQNFNNKPIILLMVLTPFISQFYIYYLGKQTINTYSLLFILLPVISFANYVSKSISSRFQQCGSNNSKNKKKKKKQRMKEKQKNKKNTKKQKRKLSKNY